MPIGSPMGIFEARRYVTRGSLHHVWTFSPSIARLVAGGNAEGPEIHTERAPPGSLRFWHFHPAHRWGDNHVFFGTGVVVPR